MCSVEATLQWANFGSPKCPRSIRVSAELRPIRCSEHSDNKGQLSTMLGVNQLKRGPSSSEKYLQPDIATSQLTTRLQESGCHHPCCRRWRNIICSRRQCDETAYAFSNGILGACGNNATQTRIGGVCRIYHVDPEVLGRTSKPRINMCFND